MRSAFIFALLSSVAFSIPVESGEDALPSKIEKEDVPKHETKFVGSEEDFGKKVEAAINRLGGCYSDEDIDPACYYDAKTAMLNLAEEVKNYNVSAHGHWRIDHELQQQKVYVFSSLDEKANKKCGEPTYDDAVCKHFNFESFAEAVKDFEIKMIQLLNRAKVDKDYFGKWQGNKEYRESRTQRRELALIKQDKWDDEKTVKEVNDSWGRAQYYQDWITAMWSSKNMED